MNVYVQVGMCVYVYVLFLSKIYMRMYIVLNICVYIYVLEIENICKI